MENKNAADREVFVRIINCEQEKRDLSGVLWARVKPKSPARGRSGPITPPAALASVSYGIVLVRVQVPITSLPRYRQDATLRPFVGMSGGARRRAGTSPLKVQAA